MSPSTSSTVAGTSSTTALGSLARQEILAYLRHPLFLVGLALTVTGAVLGPDKISSSVYHVIIPATTLGVFGILVMNGLVRRSDKNAAAAGTVVVGERTRTWALAWAAVVPFTAALAFFAWAVWAYHDQPPLPYAIPFGGYAGDGWVYAVLFALGVLSAVGGPVLGLLVGRWLRFRGAGVLTAVVVILVTIVMQGIVEPLRYVRVFAPWTYFGGPFGVDGDPERWLIITGSPQWYCVYLLALCALGVVLAGLHDREQPRAGLTRLAAALAVVAIALGTVTMTTGVQEERVNPLPSPAAE
jgi:hypothetical protein